MKRTMLLTLAAGLAAAAVAAPAMADGKSLGPPGGTIYAFDQAFKTIGTPTSMPDRGPTDTLYMFPDCATCAAVSEAAPGTPGYNGGRWKVVEAFGITTQLTNADRVGGLGGITLAPGPRCGGPLITA